MTKPIEIPQLQCLSRVADMPVVVQQQVFMVRKAMEVPQVQFPNKVDEMPVGMQRQILIGLDCSEDDGDFRVAVYW